MSITPRAQSHVQIAAAGVVPNPTGTLSGDLQVAGVFSNAAPTTVPSGWTQQAQFIQGAIYLTMYSHVAGGSEPSSYTWAASGGSIVEAGINSYYNFDAVGGPFVGAATKSSSAGTGSTAIPGQTVGAGDMLVVMCGAYAGSADGTDITVPGTMTERWQEVYASAYLMDSADEIVSSAGATGTRTFSCNGTSPLVFGVMIAIKAPSVGAALDGTSAGSATASATRVAEQQPLSGSVAGTATSSATSIRESMPLVGSSAGAATSSATRVSEENPLSATIAGTSSAAATSMNQTHQLTGEADGTSTASAASIVATQPIDGSAAGTSAASATSLRAGHALVGSTAGRATSQGWFAVPSFPAIAANVTGPIARYLVLPDDADMPYRMSVVPFGSPVSALVAASALPYRADVTPGALPFVATLVPQERYRIDVQE